MIQSDHTAKCAESSEDSNKSLVVKTRPTCSQITVNVGSVFEDGVVVYYTDSKGVEYRGAMLSQNPSKQSVYSVVRAKDVANPVAFVHDHPYSNMKRYARHVTKIPRDILLNWNTLPEYFPTPETESLEEIAAARKKLTELSRAKGADAPQLAMLQRRSATVLTSPTEDNNVSSFAQHTFTSPMEMLGGRVAKKRANTRMMCSKDDFYSDSNDFYKKSPKRKKGKSTGDLKQRTQTKRATTPGTKSKLNHSTTSSKNDSLKLKYKLKQFSIPIVRMKSNSQKEFERSSTTPFTFNSSATNSDSSSLFSSPLTISSPSTISDPLSPLLS